MTLFTATHYSLFATRPLRQYQPVPDRVADQLGGGVDVELAHRGRAVGLHRLDADAEQVRDLLVAVALGDELNHLAFPRRQRDPVVARSGLLDEIVEQRLRDMI